MSVYFEKQLKSLDQNMIEMGGLLEDSIANTARALVEHDQDLARATRKAALAIDDKEKEIEINCFKLLMQQPLAGDFRQVSSAMKMITDMERIGDQCEDICHLIVHLNKIDSEWKFKRITKMAEATINMVNMAVDSFVKKDLDLANKVIESDSIVNDLFKEIKEGIIEGIQSGRFDGQIAVDFLMIAKYFERIGDHACNIAEWVIYSITGVHNEVTQ